MKYIHICCNKAHRNISVTKDVPIQIKIHFCKIPMNKHIVVRFKVFPALLNKNKIKSISNETIVRQGQPNFAA